MMKLRQSGARVAAIAIALCILTVGAGAAQDITSQIEAANRVFMAAFEKGDSAAVAACYTAEAKMFPTGMDVVSGAEAIAAYWEAGMQGGIKRVDLITQEVEEHGDTAIEMGRVDVFDAAGKRINELKYIVIWKRADGIWKLHRDIFNTNLPATASD